MEARGRSDWWKWVAAALASTIVAALSWAGGASTHPHLDDSDVAEIVRRESPWVTDKPTIEVKLDQILETVVELKIAQARLEEQLRSQPR
jgi:hypothetical protein